MLQIPLKQNKEIKIKQNIIVNYSFPCHCHLDFFSPLLSHTFSITYLHQWVRNFIVDLLCSRVNMVDSIKSECLWGSRTISWIQNGA